MSKLLPLPNPDDWRIDDTGHVLVQRTTVSKGEAIYTLYEIRKVTWASSVKACFVALGRWIESRKPP